MTTTTQFLSPGATAYTSTTPPDGTSIGTVKVGYVKQVTTTTEYVPPSGSGYASTIAPNGTTISTVQIGYA